jgi:hypothetical protein
MASAEEAEAVSCQEGIHLTVEWVCLPMVIESDCAKLVKALAMADTSWSRWARLIKEIKEARQLLLCSHMKRTRVKSSCSKLGKPDGLVCRIEQFGFSDSSGSQGHRWL